MDCENEKLLRQLNLAVRRFHYPGRSGANDAEILAEVAGAEALLDRMFKLRQRGALGEFREVLGAQQACDIINVWLRGWNYSIAWEMLTTLVEISKDASSRRRVKAQKAIAFALSFQLHMCYGLQRIESFPLKMRQVAYWLMEMHKSRKQQREGRIRKRNRTDALGGEPAEEEEDFSRAQVQSMGMGEASALQGAEDALVPTHVAGAPIREVGAFGDLHGIPPPPRGRERCALIFLSCLLSLAKHSGISP